MNTTRFYCILILSFVWSATQAQMLCSYDVDPEAPSSTFGYFNTCPESPDGKYVAYLRYTTVPSTEKNILGEIWIWNRISNDRKKIATIKNPPLHDGVHLTWANNEVIVFQKGKISPIGIDDYSDYIDRNYDYICAANIKTGKKKTFELRGRLGHQAVNGKVPVSVLTPCNGYWGVYSLDVKTGKSTLICTPETFSDMVDTSLKSGNEDAKAWKIMHVAFSPDGKKVCMRMDIRAKKSKKSPSENHNVFVAIYTDGTHPAYFGPKPLHNNWYDNNTIIGHCGDPKNGPMKEGQNPLLKGRKGGGVYQFSMYPNIKCLDKLAPFGNHLAFSQDKQWFASENWYREDSVELRIYKKYDTHPRAIIFKNYYGKRTWGNSIHCNPSFSADGKRLYFTEVIDGHRFQGRWVNLEDIDKPELWKPFPKK